MTHKKTTKARAEFVCYRVKHATPKQVKQIYLDTEKVIHWHGHHKGNRFVK